MDVISVSDSNSLLHDLSVVIEIIMLVAALVILPLYVAYYFFRWCRYRTLAPLGVIIAIFAADMAMVPVVTQATYGSNYQIATMALTILMLGDILLFFAWIAGQVYRLWIGKNGRARMEAAYRTPGYVRDSVEEHHLMIASISPFPFIIFTLLEYNGLQGAIFNVVSAFWYLSIFFYLFVALLILAVLFQDLS